MDKEDVSAARKQVNGVFDSMKEKLSVLFPENNLSKIEQAGVTTQLLDYNEQIRKHFLKEWHMVEAQDKIIGKLEYYLEVFGHDVESIRGKIMEDEEINAHLKASKE